MVTPAALADHCRPGHGCVHALIQRRPQRWVVLGCDGWTGALPAQHCGLVMGQRGCTARSPVCIQPFGVQVRFEMAQAICQWTRAQLHSYWCKTIDCLSH